MKLTAVFGVILNLSLATCFPTTSETNCREPDDLNEKLSEHTSGDYMRYILPPQVQVLMETQEGYPDHISSTHSSDLVQRYPEQVIYGNKTCPEQLPSSSEAELSDRAMCPFYYVMTYDPTRHPTAIAEAKCKCTGCVGGDNNKGCEQFYQPIKVLRKTRCEKGVYVYEPEILQIVAGCMCAEVRSSVSQKTDRNTTPTTHREVTETTEIPPEFFY